MDIKEYLEKFRKDLQNFENTKVKCGIIGRSGVGKSSLINAIVGEQIAEVGEVETTMEIGKPYECRGLLFYDLPGCSTQKFPKETYVEKMGIKDFDCVIIVTSDRFYEDDLYLIEEVSKIPIPVYAVRTKIDFSIDRGIKRGVDEETTLQEVRKNMKENIGNTHVEGTYLTSADYPTKYDLEKLLHKISSSLSDIKRKRFISDVSITSKKIIEEKRKIADDLTYKYAALAAVNGLNPIPGLDISVDVGLLLKMSNEITNIYGLNKENQEFFNKNFNDLPDNVKFKAALAKAGAFLIKYGGQEAIMLLLKKIVGRVAAKTFSKYIPLVGQAIAAGIAFQMTLSLGEDMVNDAEASALEIFESLKNQ